ncbi:MAG: DUF120 domain-containing protein [Nanoarchaeota archaeon]
MVRLKGIVITGIGDFSYRMENVPGLLEAYEKITGMRFFPGTLNVKLKKEFSFPKKIMRLEKEKYGFQVSVNILQCKINGKKAFILRTDANERGVGNHPNTIIEIASNIKLRDKFNLKDGDEVIIEI